MITLGIEKLDIDWGKNNFFTNHSVLFQREDLTMIPYYYVDDNGSEISIMKRGFSKKLSSVKNRLDLLDYNLEQIEEEFYGVLDYFNQLNNIEIPIKFKDYYDIISRIDLRRITKTPEENLYDYDMGDYINKCIVNGIEELEYMDSIKKYTLFDFLLSLSPYIKLRILAENSNNSDLNLQWRVADVIENGWILEKDVEPNLSEDKKILIVTEGSADTEIIKKSINLIYEDISDFFDFIDMENNYPFTGTGNLKNFIKGLSKIKIQNKILVILDNDTAGVETFEDLTMLDLPSNLHIMTLPSHESFNYIKCYGPQGSSYENINGRAVAIEAFLDFESIEDEIYVRWTSFNKKLCQYQGVIEPKNKLIKAYYNSHKIDYNFSKIKFLLDFILKSWNMR